MNDCLVPARTFPRALFICSAAKRGGVMACDVRYVQVLGRLRRDCGQGEHCWERAACSQPGRRRRCTSRKREPLHGTAEGGQTEIILSRLAVADERALVDVIFKIGPDFFMDRQNPVVFS